jgi:hypothetical protein
MPAGSRPAGSQLIWHEPVLLGNRARAAALRKIYSSVPVVLMQSSLRSSLPDTMMPDLGMSRTPLEVDMTCSAVLRALYIDAKACLHPS